MTEKEPPTREQFLRQNINTMLAGFWLVGINNYYLNTHRWFWYWTNWAVWALLLSIQFAYGYKLQRETKKIEREIKRKLEGDDD